MPEQNDYYLTLIKKGKLIHHPFWNASDAIHPLVTAVAGVLAYSFLLAAILKARQLSPTRSQNFATQYYPDNSR